ncbi:hypothetical protein XELAEV_18001880mg [Xenopus laevis]|uniref:Uncharacterized protein n=1 Tax=Xenopus laevis TaxID=8355 RepID=A0A974GYP9_XENLA|nr:hypothetical protein XELAEV_18001880mg [Xenopus laevis]
MLEPFLTLTIGMGGGCKKNKSTSCVLCLLLWDDRCMIINLKTLFETVTFVQIVTPSPCFEKLYSRGA